MRRASSPPAPTRACATARSPRWPPPPPPPPSAAMGYATPLPPPPGWLSASPPAARGCGSRSPRCAAGTPLPPPRGARREWGGGAAAVPEWRRPRRGPARSGWWPGPCSRWPSRREGEQQSGPRRTYAPCRIGTCPALPARASPPSAPRVAIRPRLLIIGPISVLPRFLASSRILCSVALYSTSERPTNTRSLHSGRVAMMARRRSGVAVGGRGALKRRQR